MTLTAEQARQRDEARVWDRDKPITKIEEHEHGWTINLGSTGFGLSKENLGEALPPAVGDPVTLYTHRGSLIRGVDLRGEPLFFKTDVELVVEHEQWVAEKHQRERQEFEEKRVELDAQFEALPDVFQRRIQWFRDHNPDFRWSLEAYEMMACVDAVRIAVTMGSADEVRRYGKASMKKQKKLVPDVQYDRHSGNSFDFACRLAHLYSQEPLLVVAEHGAMTPVTGCEDYGCAHPRDTDVEAARVAFNKEGEVE